MATKADADEFERLAEACILKDVVIPGEELGVSDDEFVCPGCGTSSDGWCDACISGPPRTCPYAAASPAGLSFQV
jgi:hypothetical protein